MTKLLNLENLKKLSLRENPFWDKESESCAFEMTLGLKFLSQIDKLKIDEAFLKKMHAWQEKKWKQENEKQDVENEEQPMESS